MIRCYSHRRKKKRSTRKTCVEIAKHWYHHLQPGTIFYLLILKYTVKNIYESSSTARRFRFFPCHIILRYFSLIGNDIIGYPEIESSIFVYSMSKRDQNVNKKSPRWIITTIFHVFSRKRSKESCYQMMLFFPYTGTGRGFKYCDRGFSIT